MVKLLTMDSKNEVIQRSCSAVQSRAAGKSSNSLTGSLTDLTCLQQSVTANNFLHDILHKVAYHQQSKSFSKNNTYYNRKQELFFENDDTIHSCPFSETFDENLSSYVIQELKHLLQNLKLELADEKNTSQILKRDILIAKKVVKMEVGANKEDFASLLEKDKSGTWKGRQKIILSLKRKLRYINEKIRLLDDETENLWYRKKSNSSAEVMPEITDDRHIYLCLELERREVLKNAERYRQNYVFSRDLMKRSLERLSEKIDKLEKEGRYIRKKLSVTPKQIDEELIQYLLKIKNQLKFKLQEKNEVRRKINILEHENSLNSIIKEELEKDLITQKDVLRKKEEEVKLLKVKNAEIQAMSESAKKERNEEAALRKKNFEDAEKKYENIIKKSENLLQQLTDSKNRLETKKKIQEKKSPVRLIIKFLSAYPTKMTKEQLDLHRGVGDSVLSIEVSENRTAIYKRKLLLYQSIFRVLHKRNQDKTKKTVELMNETKEWTFDMVENRCLMLQLAFDIKALKNRNKKLKKIVIYSTRRQYSKRKNSSQLMMEILNEKKTYLAVKKKENECLKSLIRHVLASKGDDFNLLQSYIMKNNDIFLDQLTGMKFLNLSRK